MINKKTDKKTNVNKISYGILCLIMGFLFVFYLDAITFVLLFFTMVLPFVSMAVCKYCVKNIKVELSFKDKQIKQDEKTVLKIGIVNDTVLPLSDVYVVFTIKNSFEGKEEEWEVNYFAQSRKDACVELEVESATCCHIVAECKGFYMYDYMGMYKTGVIKADNSDECYVFPYDEQIIISNGLGQEDEEEGERDVKGEDVSEVADIREFRPGDRMSRIHWKITTKCDEIMVKEYELEYGNKMVVGFDLWEGADYEKLDKMLVVLYNVGRMLVDSNRTFSYKWYDGNIDEYREVEVLDMETCQEAFRYILESKPVASKDMFYCNEREVNNQKLLYITGRYGLEFAGGDIVGEVDGEVVLLWV